jgi:mannitol 2-dehydrogenase
MAAASNHTEDPLAFVRNAKLFGTLSENENFTAPYRVALDMLHNQGARATLAALVGEDH